MSRARRTDAAALAALLLMWLVCFGRALPLHEGALVPPAGDFYGQFYTFSAYQYDRMSSGQFPLWNPFNHGGFPFIADPQAAVAYPPRVVALWLAHLAGGWSASALLLEGLAHYLIASLGWYAFLRWLTRTSPVSPAASLAGTLAAVYGGFLTGYPLLQLAILETAAWLPYTLLGVALAFASGQPRPFWLLMAGCTLALSWLAGHSQTAWFCTVMAVVWLAWQAWCVRTPALGALSALALLGGVTVGASAVTLLPGIEYLRLTSRADLDFAAKVGGFLVRDVVQMLVPGVISWFSPLFISVVGLMLALWSLRTREGRFWGVMALAALLLSFGGNAPFYGLVYPLPTGLSFFRGQERFAFLVTSALAVMVALGSATLADASLRRSFLRYVRAWLVALVLLCLLLTALATLDDAAMAVLVAAWPGTAAVFALWMIARRRWQPAAWAVVGVIALELVRFNLASMTTFVAPAALPRWDTTALTDVVRAQPGVFRVDGFRGLHDNYASVAQVQDIRGISPLFLTSAERIINRSFSHNPLAWELFAVRYVYSDRTAFSTPTRILGSGQDRDGDIVLHEVIDPRPFAHLLTQVDVVDSDDFAWALLTDPRYQPRDALILLGEPAHPPDAATSGSAEVTSFAPEHLRITVTSSGHAMLSLALVDYPGWQAQLNGRPVPIRRAYGALMAIDVPPGDHKLVLTYRPPSAIIGGMLTTMTWASALLALLLSRWWRGR